MLIGRFALALAVFGPPLVGVVALVVSLRRFRAARARPSILAAITALIIWVAVCAGATILGFRFAFAYAWMWAHSKRDLGRAVLLSDYLGALGIVCAGLLVLGGCWALLHRLVRLNAQSI